MATIPEEWQPASYEEAPSSTAPSRPVSMFWRYYWIMTGGAGLLSIGLLIAQANPDVAGLLLLLAICLFIAGLLPSLISTAERQVGYSLTLRNPDYHHQWSSEARWWWGFHWIMLLVIALQVILAIIVPPQRGRETPIILGVVLSCTYLVTIAFVLSWRWRRMRLANLAGLEELQSFELVLESEEIFTELAAVLPIFSGKLKGRCPFLLRRNLGDWSVLLFDWLDINKQPARREWITVALIGLHQPLPMLSLQPTERVATSQLHWWHILLEFPFGLIIFLISAATHFTSKLKAKPPLAIAHTPALTRGYQLDAFQIAELQKFLTPAVCLDIISYVHKKKRFVMVNLDWLLLASHKKEVAPGKLGELVADALRLTDLLERAKG